MTFTVDVRDGQIASQAVRAAIRRHIASLDGKRINVTIDVRRPRRSDEQNAFFHKICEIVGDRLGYEKEEMKAIWKRMFLSVEKNGLTYVLPTAQLTTALMSDLIDRCIRWSAMEHGIVIEDPRWR